MKKMAKVVVLVSILCLVVPSLCFAYTGWADATVNMVGQGTSSYALVQLTAAGKFTSAWFALDNTGVNSKSMLATALTAYSLGKTVHVNVVTGSPAGNITTIYANP